MNAVFVFGLIVVLQRGHVNFCTHFLSSSEICCELFFALNFSSSTFSFSSSSRLSIPPSSSSLLLSSCAPLGVPSNDPDKISYVLFSNFARSFSVYALFRPIVASNITFKSLNVISFMFVQILLRSSSLSHSKSSSALDVVASRPSASYSFFR